MNYYLQSNLDILNEIGIRMRDVEHERWTATEKEYALNSVMNMWSSKVKVPYIYTVAGGWVHSSFSYTLPDYIDPRYMHAQIRSSALDASIDFGDNTLETWITIPGWTWEPNASGGSDIRLDILPYSEDGRIIFWREPFPVPIGSITLNANITDSATSLGVVTSVINLPPCGYILLGNEWIQYAGYTTTGSVATLTNLVRGVYGTTAASGTAGDAIYWGVPVDRIDLYEHLYNKAASFLHRMLLTDAAPNDLEQHQWNMRYFDQLADEFWRTYSSGYQPRMHLVTWPMLTKLEGR